MFLAVVVLTFHTLACTEETSSSVGVLCLARGHSGLWLCASLNGLENILNHVRLKFKCIIFSGNHDNHAWSSIWLP